MGAYTVKIETGTYSGAGAAKAVDMCDGPDFALTKRIDGTATVCHSMWRHMPRNGSNSFGASQAEKTGQLTDLTKDGIYVGTGQAQSGALYAYLAIKALRGQQHVAFGRYYGDGTDNRDLLGHEGCPFSANWLGMHRATDGQPGRFRTSEHVGDLSNTPLSAAGANSIQSFAATGFQVGTSQNTSGAYHNWYALKEIQGGIKVGSFTGTGVAQAITVGFAPTMVWVKNHDTADAMYMLSQGMVDNAISSHPVSAAATSAQAISGLAATGFAVGTDAACNGSGNKILWIAFKDGEYSPGVTRTLR